MVREQLWRAAESVLGAHVAGSCARVPASVPIRMCQLSWPGCLLLGPGFLLHTRTNCSQTAGSQRPPKLKMGDIPCLSFPALGHRGAQRPEIPLHNWGWFTPPIPCFFSAELWARGLHFALWSLAFCGVQSPAPFPLGPPLAIPLTVPAGFLGAPETPLPKLQIAALGVHLGWVGRS